MSTFDCLVQVQDKYHFLSYIICHVISTILLPTGMFIGQNNAENQPSDRGC